MELFYLLIFLSTYTLTIAGGNVIELTDNDFSDRLAHYETLLVMFYAPWCGHCKRLKPEYEKAAGLLKDNDPPVSLARIDCTEAGKETCNKFSVNGYPTLKIFKNGDLSQEYNGPREATGIVKYMQAQAGPSSKELNSLDDFKKFLERDETVVIGFFPKESPLKEAFFKTSEKMKEKVSFGHTFNENIIEQAGIRDGIILYRPRQMKNKFEPDDVKFSGEPTTEHIQTFINKNYHGLVGHRKRENMNDFQTPLVVAYYGVDYVKNAKGTNYWRNRILKVAKDFAEDFTFAISAKDEFQYELDDFGVGYASGGKPLIFAKNKKNQKFNMKDDFSPEGFEKFLKDLRNGDLEPFLKSEPIPEDNSGPVKQVVAKNFDEVVTNSGRDSLIEFYAPWCGHCQKLAPVYDELGEKMSSEDVDIIKMDAVSNDVPAPYEVRGFPTIYWAPKDKKSEPIRYEGGRDLQDFIKYIAKHSTNTLKNFDRNGKPKQDEL